MSPHHGNVDALRARSGLRPAGAFLAIGSVLVMVALAAINISRRDVYAEGRAADATRHTRQSPTPDYDILDRGGVPLAFSVRKLSLVAYPRALWRAHTPERMAQRLENLLGDVLPAQEVLERTLGVADGGWIQVPLEDLSLTREQASRVADWASRGVWTSELAEKREWIPLEGIALDKVEPAYAADEGSSSTAVNEERYQLAWRPLSVLSEETRTRQAGSRISAMRWTTQFLYGLCTALRGGGAPGGNETARARERARQASVLWKSLLPKGYVRLLDETPLDRAWDLSQMLEAEAIKSHQLELLPGMSRVHPQADGECGEALAILGSWGFIGQREAQEMVTAELGVVPGEVEGADRAIYERRVRQALATRHPRSGIELACDRLLRSPDWAFLESAAGATYRFAEYYNARPPRGSRRYYLDAAPATEPPSVVTTLDMGLQLFVRRVLLDVQHEHDPAVAMAICVDVDSGGVLAVDGISSEEVQAFLPTWHLFTPGSTFKANVMAIALDEGVVEPDSLFDAHNGTYRVPESRRIIREAEGPRRGVVTASDGFAQSLNAVFAQIGVRVEDARFRAKLEELGYGAAPGLRLGTERAGLVPDLPWNTPYTHSSISFGHEIQVSLWQHAAGLASILRGGEWKPLRLFEFVEQGGERYEVPVAEEPRRVFTERTCIRVREMMYMGAREGTGRSLNDPTLAMGTKTGTTEKVGTELCLHLELEHNRLVREGKASGGEAHRCGRTCRAELVARETPHKGSCYTSSICAFGHLQTDEEALAREVMVLVVVDEPRGGEKFGSRVAGPAAMRILQEALGRTEDGVSLAERIGVRESAVTYEDLNEEDAPWAAPAKRLLETVGGVR